MAVRSLNLANGGLVVANAPITVFTCPAGRTVILKDVRLWVSGASSVSTVLAAGSPDGLVLLVNEVISPAAVRSLQPWIVLEPGHTLQMSQNVANSVRYWLSGAELAGVA